MSYLVLARKYRPQTFSQVVEQDHVTRTLSNAISSNRVAHAVLFSGPRGTGKTTVARILAKALNCEEKPDSPPCNTCRSCREITSGKAVDVFEIDGASNNSVDQIRELRDHIKYMPAHSPYKIYIIDEVHMLSMSAFNALLKTLEEPPPHVMFMFATTEPQKIPITILSRCQRHDFRRISLKSIVDYMATICNEENFQMPTESLVLIAREATGSMRDALSLLDQVLSCFKDSVSHEQVLDILGVIDRKYLVDLCGAILQGAIADILETLDECYHRGYDLKMLYSNILEHFRNLLIIKIGKNVHKLVDLPVNEVEQMAAQTDRVSPADLYQVFDQLYSEETKIRLAPDPKLALEMAFIRMDQIKPALPIDALIDKLDLLRQEIGIPSVGGPAAYEPGADSGAAGPKREIKNRQPEAGPKSQSLKPDPSTGAHEERTDLDTVWRQLNEIIAAKHPSLGANLTKCRLKQVSADHIEIEVVGNGFTLNMLQREKNIAALKKCCTVVFRKEMDVVLTALSEPDEENPKKKSRNNYRIKQKALSHPLVTDAIEIFNGKLVDVKINS